MQKIVKVLLVLILGIGSLYAGKGKVEIESSLGMADIYVDGKRKAGIGNGDNPVILLEEGHHTIKVVKDIDAIYEYTRSRDIFVKKDTYVVLGFDLKKKEMTAKRKKAVVEAARLAGWQRDGEVVADTKRGFMWQDNTAAKSTKKEWEGAIKYCQNLSLSGYNDWRLPTKDELYTILIFRIQPSIEVLFRNVTASDSYWSSSQLESNEKRAWGLHFVYLSIPREVNKASKLYVRCVRGERGKKYSDLGTKYYFGRGVTKNYTKAREYYTKACSKKEKSGCSDLGYLYHYGKGININYTKAKNYYDMACWMGDSEACNGLGHLYYNGQGVTQSYAKARGYYSKACNMGYKKACSNYQAIKNK